MTRYKAARTGTITIPEGTLTGPVAAIRQVAAWAHAHLVEEHAAGRPYEWSFGAQPGGWPGPRHGSITPRQLIEARAVVLMTNLRPTRKAIAPELALSRSAVEEIFRNAPGSWEPFRDRGVVTPELAARLAPET
jgi:hypothetical protein